jgi:hypothetical protein
VAARLVMGRGGALAAVGFFLAVRGSIALIVGPGLGEIVPMFPLYLGSAVLVEIVALAAAPLIRRPLAFGAVAGAAIGTLGHLSEAWWTQLTQTLGWGSDILVEGTLMALTGGVAGGLLGALLGSALHRRLARPAVARTVLVGALLAVAAAVTNGLLATVPGDVRATFAIDDVQQDPRTANISVQLDPVDALDDPAWVQITSWQGGSLVVTALERTGEGSYRTTEPVPLHGTWKTLLRLHDGRVLTAVPLYLPADDAIGADEVPADDGMTRAAGPENEILQREMKDDVSGGVWAVANVVVLVCTLALVMVIAWGVGRYSRRASARERLSPVVADPPDGQRDALPARSGVPSPSVPGGR